MRLKGLDKTLASYPLGNVSGRRGMLLWRFGKVRETCLLKKTLSVSTTPWLWQSEQLACRRDFEFTTQSKAVSKPSGSEHGIWPSLESTLPLNYSARCSFLVTLNCAWNTEITLNKKRPKFWNSSLSIAEFFRLTEKTLSRTYICQSPSPLSIHPYVSNPDITHSQSDKHLQPSLSAL